MTVAAVEAAPALEGTVVATGANAGRAGAGGGSVARRPAAGRPATQQGDWTVDVTGSGYAPRRPQAARTGRRPAPEPVGQAPANPAQSAPAPPQEIRMTYPAAPSRYRRIVLAEFAATAVIVGASPILVPRKPTATGTAVSLAGPMVRLTAVCLLFFILALMSSGPRTGKIAAAFGGLVMLGALLNATESIGAINAVFAPRKAPSAAAEQAPGKAAEEGGPIG